MKRASLAALLLAAALGTSVGAQVRDAPGLGTPERRAEMEQRFRARLGQLVRERLDLTADQARRLEEVDQRYQPERRRLMAREMEVRRGLRQQIQAGESADQATTAALLDQMIALQRERTELLAREQRELAAFLTPVQRAKLVGLQAELHRRVMSARRGGPGRHRGAAPGRRGPPREPH